MVQPKKLDLQQQYPPPVHNYPTRFKRAIAANTTQLEQQQMINPTSVIHQFFPDTVEPPSPLKYTALLKTDEAPVWKAGMCNELGRLAQGYKDIYGNNTIYFIFKHQVPKHKKTMNSAQGCGTRNQSEWHQRASGRFPTIPPWGQGFRG